jgi:hypothetical protein
VHTAKSYIAQLLGDFAEEQKEYLQRYPGLTLPGDPGQQIQILRALPGSNVQVGAAAPAIFLINRVAVHDLAAARAVLAEAPGFVAGIRHWAVDYHDIRGEAVPDAAVNDFRAAELYLAMANQDWPKIVQTEPLIEVEQARLNVLHELSGPYAPVDLWPRLAFAQAKMGRFAAAHATIDRTPGDCDLCLRMHGEIDAAEKNYGGSAFWFARAIQQAPSIPFAYTDWGQMLLDKGDVDGAIAQFTLSNNKGPHFADPIEMWGEDLMAKNRSDLALAKFTEAENYAPNWGRLHLKWGEALTYAGKPDEAKKQFSEAAGLDLAAADKSELARMNHG